jgi:hypothetical protein
MNRKKIDRCFEILNEISPKIIKTKNRGNSNSKSVGVRICFPSNNRNSGILCKDGKKYETVIGFTSVFSPFSFHPVRNYIFVGGPPESCAHKSAIKLSTNGNESIRNISKISILFLSMISYHKRYDSRKPNLTFKVDYVKRILQNIEMDYMNMGGYDLTKKFPFSKYENIYEESINNSPTIIHDFSKEVIKSVKTMNSIKVENSIENVRKTIRDNVKILNEKMVVSFFREAVANSILNS